MSEQWILLALAWILYFVIHSALASLRVKAWVARRWPRAMAAYRLIYNLIALGLLAVPLGLLWRDPGPVLWRWSGWTGWVADGLAALALLGFLHSLRHYDGAEFLGLRQWRERTRRIEDLERFHLSPFHGYVRHPWYFFGLVILWTRDMTLGWLITCLLATAYFWIGSRLEERKLLTYHGEVYRRYREQVPALFPLPWRRLSAEARAALLAEAAAQSSSSGTGSASNASTTARTSASSQSNPP